MLNVNINFKVGQTEFKLTKLHLKYDKCFNKIYGK